MYRVGALRDRCSGPQSRLSPNRGLEPRSVGPHFTEAQWGAKMKRLFFVTAVLAALTLSAVIKPMFG
jgi:hypothetical protein